MTIKSRMTFKVTYIKIIKAVLTGGERIKEHVCGWVQVERSDEDRKVIKLYYLTSPHLPFLSLSFHLSLCIHLSWLLPSLCSFCCGPESGLRTKATLDALDNPHPRSGGHYRAALMGGYVNQLPLICLAQDREQSIGLETDREVTGKCSGQNKWIIYVSEHINACPDMFISQPHAYCEEAVFVSLWNFCISICLDWVNMHIYW